MRPRILYFSNYQVMLRLWSPGPHVSSKCGGAYSGTAPGHSEKDPLRDEDTEIRRQAFSH